MKKTRKTKLKSSASKDKTQPASKSKPPAYGSGCANKSCKLRVRGCAGFEGCPGFMARG